MIVSNKFNKMNVFGRPNMKTIPVEDAVGKVLGHDITQIVPGFFKGRAFKKADIVSMGHGGFCSNCQDCRYPVCSFGKAG